MGRGAQILRTSRSVPPDTAPDQGHYGSCQGVVSRLAKRPSFGPWGSTNGVAPVGRPVEHTRSLPGHSDFESLRAELDTPQPVLFIHPTQSPMP